MLFVVSYALFCACGFLCMLYLSTRIWYDTDLIYPLLHWLKQVLPYLLMAGFAAGIISILWYDYGRMKELVAKEKEEAMRLAEQSEKRKNDLVMYLAHDLKTPLTSVIGYLELLQNTPELSEDNRQRYMETVRGKAERLEDLINEFFEITRYNLTSITLEKSRINLTRMLEQLIFEFQPVFTERGLSCGLDAEPDVPFVCDADRIQRVFDNLLKNAVCYSFPETVIRVALERREHGVSVVFENEGNPIPEEKLAHIFEQFFRLDSARGTKEGGAGVGLAIAKEIVELHGGRITASSTGERIRFEVWLPS